MRFVVLALCVLMLMVTGIVLADIPYVVGDTPADFTLNDADGVPVSLYDSQGQVIWLVFWTDT